MSNKTSDKNVGRIENDIENIKKYIDLVLNRGYCDCNELNVISTGRYCDGSKNVAYSMQNILAEREQDKKRIKELEEEIAMLKKASNIAKEVNIEDVTDVINESCKEFMSNYIPKQAVKDKIEELMIQGNYKTFYNPNGRTHFLKEESDCKIEVLQELLEGEKNNENIKS